MSVVRWGVLSTAKIGTVKVIPAMQQAENCEIVAIASRHADRAAEVASELKIPMSYGSYEELLADPEIDAVYNPLPNHLHVDWSVKALEAGKHVLCEKPIGLTAREGRRLVEVGKQHPRLKLMEAFMYRHHPQWKRAKEIVENGGIGRLRTVQSFFSYFNDDAGDIRNQAELGGGGLMDIGCYNISLSRFLFDAEPDRVMGMTETDPNFQTDRITSGMLDFGGEHGTSTFTCSTQLVPYQRVNIFGTTGRIEIEIPFNAPPDLPCRLWLQSGTEIEEIQFEICDQYTIQGKLFADAVLNDTAVPTPITDAVSNMEVIERLKKSAASGDWH